MYYIVDKHGQVIGSADGPVDANDLASRGERAIHSNLDLPPFHVELGGTPDQPTIVEIAAPPAGPEIVLTTSAEDRDGDGIPELPANGRSKVTIAATLQDEAGNVVSDPVEVQFRTSAGTLSHRTMRTDGGHATVQLTSSRETVTATVRVTAAGFAPAQLELEFAPVGT